MNIYLKRSLILLGTLLGLLLLAVLSVLAKLLLVLLIFLVRPFCKTQGTIGCYITLARSSAERIIWPDLKKLNREYGLGGMFERTQKLSLALPNESIIYLMGGT